MKNGSNDHDPEPNKDPVDIKLYKLISLLPIISKLFDKLFLQNLMPLMIVEKRLISKSIWIL